MMNDYFISFSESTTYQPKFIILAERRANKNSNSLKFLGNVLQPWDEIALHGRHKEPEYYGRVVKLATTRKGIIKTFNIFSKENIDNLEKKHQGVIYIPAQFRRFEKKPELLVELYDPSRYQIYFDKKSFEHFKKSL